MSINRHPEIEGAPGMCQHGNFPFNCESCKAETLEASPEQRRDRMKTLQMQIVQEWAGRQNPPLHEGTDFRFVSDITTVLEHGENLASHERVNLYFGYRKEHFKIIRANFAMKPYHPFKALLEYKWGRDSGILTTNSHIPTPRMPLIQIKSIVKPFPPPVRVVWQPSTPSTGLRHKE